MLLSEMEAMSRTLREQPDSTREDGGGEVAASINISLIGYVHFWNDLLQAKNFKFWPRRFFSLFSVLTRMNHCCLIYLL